MFNSNYGGYSLSDIAAATGSGRTGSDGVFGDNGAWWIIILFLFVFSGWGGRGGLFGGNGGQGTAYDGYVLTSDFANLERKLDGINNGICDSTFALNNTITTGFNGVQQSLCQGFNGVNTSLLQGINGISSQIADCCCTTQRAIDGVNYNMATNTCAITNAISTGVRDVIDNQNANYRALHEELVANKLEAKNDRIAEQQNEITALRLAASQANQNAYLLNELKPCPSPAYIVPNPNCCTNTCGYTF